MLLLGPHFIDNRLCIVLQVVLDEVVVDKLPFSGQVDLQRVVQNFQRYIVKSNEILAPDVLEVVL